MARKEFQEGAAGFLFGFSRADFFVVKFKDAQPQVLAFDGIGIGAVVESLKRLVKQGEFDFIRQGNVGLGGVLARWIVRQIKFHAAKEFKSAVAVQRALAQGANGAGADATMAEFALIMFRADGIQLGALVTAGSSRRSIMRATARESFTAFSAAAGATWESGMAGCQGCMDFASNAAASTKPKRCAVVSSSFCSAPGRAAKVQASAALPRTMTAPSDLASHSFPG